MGIELGAACMPSGHASDQATAPGIWGKWTQVFFLSFYTHKCLFHRVVVCIKSRFRGCSFGTFHTSVISRYSSTFSPIANRIKFTMLWHITLRGWLTKQVLWAIEPMRTLVRYKTVPFKTVIRACRLQDPTVLHEKSIRTLILWIHIVLAHINEKWVWRLTYDRKKRMSNSRATWIARYPEFQCQTQRREETEKGEVRQIGDIYARASTHIVSWKQI